MSRRLGVVELRAPTELALPEDRLHQSAEMVVEAAVAEGGVQREVRVLPQLVEAGVWEPTVLGQLQVRGGPWGLLEVTTV